MLDEEKIEGVAEVAEPIVEAGEEAPDAVEAEAEEGESVITFGDDEPPEVDSEPAPEWVKDLRKQNRAQAQEIAALKKATAKTDETIAPLSARPKFDDADFDDDKHAELLDNWYEEKKAHDSAKADRDNAAQKEQDDYQARFGEYADARKAFDPEVISEAEAVVSAAFSDRQQAAMVDAIGKGAAALLVGLASNEKHLQDLAGTKNLIQFAAKVARLESKMKTTTRKPKTVPESRVVGSASTDMGGTTLEKLEAEADETGDRSKIVAFKRQQRLANK